MEMDSATRGGIVRELLLKSTVFIAILLALWLWMDPLFLNHSKKDVASYEMFYDTKKESVDILFLGNSHLHRGLDTRIIDAKCGANSQLLYSGGLNIVQIYFNLLETLKTQSPKLVVIETWPLFAASESNNNSFKNDKLVPNNDNASYLKRIGRVKYEETTAAIDEYVFYHLFNSFRFHDRWTDLEMLSQSLETRFRFSPEENYFNEFHRIDVVSQANRKKYQELTSNIEYMCISDAEEQYIIKILDLAKSNNFKVLFFTVPVYEVYFEQNKHGFERVHSELNEILKGHKDQAGFYDLNIKLQGLDYTSIINEEKVSSNQHVNLKGLLTTSNALANYINKNYKLNKAVPDHNQLRLHDYLYSRVEILKDDAFKARIVQINDTLVSHGAEQKIFRIPESVPTLRIQGWMQKDGLTDSKHTKYLALKHESGEVFIYPRRLLYYPVSALVKQHGAAWKNAGFVVKFDKHILRKGKYKVFYALKSESGEYHLKDLWKWIEIE